MPYQVWEIKTFFISSYDSGVVPTGALSAYAFETTIAEQIKSNKTHAFIKLLQLKPQYV